MMECLLCTHNLFKFQLHNINVHQIIMLHTLNLYYVLCQISLNKAGKTFQFQPLESDVHLSFLRAVTSLITALSQGNVFQLIPLCPFLLSIRATHCS